MKEGCKNANSTASRVAVIDDDSSVREALSSLIRSAGYECDLYHSGEAFLTSDGLENTACVVLDVRMPGLSGLELHDRLLGVRCALPIVYVTAHMDDGARVMALRRGAVAYLSKPCDDEVLLCAIRVAMNGSR
jgi:FixJ family two-component response regulator